MANQLRKMNIYDVNEAIENALLYGVDEWGEVLEEDQIKEYVDKLEMTQQSKMEYMAKLTINNESFIEDAKKEIKKMQQKIEVIQNGNNRTKDYLDKFIRSVYTDEDGVLDEEGLRKFKFKSPSVEISYRKSSKVEVLDESKLTNDLKTVVVESKPNKTAIKEHLKELGVDETDFAKIVTNINMSIK